MKVRLVPYFVCREWSACFLFSSRGFADNAESNDLANWKKSFRVTESPMKMISLDCKHLKASFSGYE